MTPAEAQEVKEALTKLMGKVKVIKQKGTDGIVWKVTLPLKGHDGEDFRLYVTGNSYNKRITFCDAGALLKTLKGCGDLRLKSIQDVLNTFGLTLMEDLSVWDISYRALPIRLLSFLQAWCAVDGVIRIWKTSQEEIRRAIRPAA
jgi:hypothetical protein